MRALVVLRSRGRDLNRSVRERTWPVVMQFLEFRRRPLLNPIQSWLGIVPAMATPAKYNMTKGAAIFHRRISRLLINGTADV